mgnify:CR=1 FL=1
MIKVLITGSEGFIGSSLRLLSAVCAPRLRAGPPLTWNNGWGLGKAAHRSAALEHQERYRPRIIVSSPNVWSWKVEDGGTMSLSEQEALQTMALLIQGQINANDFWLVKAPWRSGLWKCDLWSSILAMVPKTYEEALLHQVLDECRHNLRNAPAHVLALAFV